ncbi:MAG: hypothetical protein K1X75_14580 [Leptospirales bacterium]|nr:hypothetical protein [Leptospirales bacterium]
MSRGVSRRKAIPFALLLTALSCVTNCNQSDRTTPAWTAQTRINAAYQVKVDQCDSDPGLWLIVPHDVREEDVQLCVAELLAAACPLRGTPAGCLYMLLKPAPAPDTDGI